MSVWSRLTSGIAGFGIGAATADVVLPELEPLRQTAWRNAPSRVLPAAEAALAALRGYPTQVDLADDAARNGIGPARFALLQQLATVFPGVAPLLELQRRGFLAGGAWNAPGADMTAALKRLGYDPTYSAALEKLLPILLSLDQIANGVQQGHLPNPGVLPDVSAAVQPATGQTAPATPDGQPPTDVPLTQVALDPLAEAQGHGADLARLQVIANLVGLPPGSAELLTMWNRGLITETAVDAGLREGHLKTKWSGAFKRMRWNVLSPQEYASARLRTWVTADESYAGGALTGHTKEQMDLLFLNRGRPASPTQMWTAWARKIVGPSGTPVEYADHAKAIAISDIRPEYAEMLWGIRFTYPTAFVLRQLTETGVLTAAEASKYLQWNRWDPVLADQAANAWSKGVGAATKAETKTELRSEYEGLHISRAELLTALEQLGFDATTAAAEADLGDDARVRKARDEVVAAAHASYLLHQLTDAEATAGLEQAGVVPEAVGHLLTTWQLELSLTHKPLTAAQIRSAYRKALLTAPDALARLEDLHLSAADANTFLLS